VCGVLPSARAGTRADALRYRLEPYVLAGDVYAEPPHAGRGGWSWYTGAAGWLHRFIVEALLGIQIRGDRLTIAPCLPASWPGYRARLRRGEATIYRIEVDNASGAGRGVRELSLDGRSLAGAAVQLADDGVRHEVHVVLDSAGRRPLARR
jgi:cellobiose phosphorylase